MTSALLLLRSERVGSWPTPSLFLKEGGHVAMVSAYFPLEKRRSVVIVTLIPHPEGRLADWKVAMTSALVLL